MNRVALRTAPLAAVAVFVLSLTTTACASRRTAVVVASTPSGSVVYVQTAPPAPRHDVRPHRPVAKAVWIPGHYHWNGRNYVWMGGHWNVKPKGNKWVAGHWKKQGKKNGKKHDHGWYWVPGHWK
ncbi:MAG: hypothetical protein V3U67_01350 [Gemmatimonadota bacterium]